MAPYLKISAYVGGSSNRGLKQAIEFIGKHYDKKLSNKKCHKQQSAKLQKDRCSKRSNKKKKNDKNDYEKGIDYLVKKFKSKRAITRMVYSVQAKIENTVTGRIENAPNARRWFFHERYEEAYRFIVRKLLKCRNDKEYVVKLLNDLYNEIIEQIGEDDRLDHRCSDALIFWQKDMLAVYMDGIHILDIASKKRAGEILDKIERYDKHIPQ